MNKNQDKIPLISIIVPVYRVEDYLECCVNSIQDQTYSNLEIILVDDGSPDRCGDICEQIAKSDSRIQVLHKKNGGLGDARNYGIERAKGSYLVFVDSDDMLDSDFIATLYHAMIDSEAEMAICGFTYLNDITKLKEKVCTFEKQEVITGRDLQYRYFDSYELSMLVTVAWNKIYPKHYFDYLKYPKGKLHEDEFTTLRVMDLCKKVVLVPTCGYLYRMRETSIMDTFNVRRFDLFDAYINRIQYYYDVNALDLLELTLKRYLHMFEQYVEWQTNKGDSDDNYILDEYRRRLKEQITKMCIKLSFKLKFEYELSMKAPHIYHKIWKLNNRSK